MLKRCPFCDGTAFIRYIVSPAFGDNAPTNKTFVECGACGAQGPAGENNKGLDNWNSRAS